MTFDIRTLRTLVVWFPNHRKSKQPRYTIGPANLTRQPYMKGTNYRISGDLTNTDNVMNNTFWIGVQPALTREMLEFVTNKIEIYLGIHC